MRLSICHESDKELKNDDESISICHESEKRVMMR